MSSPPLSSPNTASTRVAPDDMNTAAFFSRLENYNWDQDSEFLSGLTAILGPNPLSTDQEQVDELTLRARCFYYAQKLCTPTIDFTSYRAWRAEQPVSSLTPLSTDSAAASARWAADLHESNQAAQIPNPAQPDYPASFTEVMELIQSGKPIPGIREIPETVLVGQGTEPTVDRRRKPWEISHVNGDASQRIFGSDPTRRSSG